MNSNNLPERIMLLFCFIAAPLLQLAGDCLWLSGLSRHWSLIREASYLFFVPLGFVLYKNISPKSAKWAIVFIALFITGCFGVANMMPLYHLGAYDSLSTYEFPFVVNIAFSKDIFAFTIFLPGLCFPLSHVVAGSIIYRYNLLSKVVGMTFIAGGVFFWLGNAGRQPLFLIGGDVLLLTLYTCLGRIYSKGLFSYDSAKDEAKFHKVEPEAEALHTSF